MASLHGQEQFHDCWGNGKGRDREGTGDFKSPPPPPPPLFLYSDSVGKVPSEDALEEIGIQVHGKGAGGTTKGKTRETEHEAGSSSSQILALLENAGEGEQGQVTQEPMVVTGLGLAALPKKTVGKILAFEYVDFNEFPPAKGKNRSLPQTLEGQVVVVQAVDLVQTKKLIPDLETWIQCFSLFVATLLPHHPGCLAEFMAYQSIIAKASARYKWPSWIIYDQSFRQDVESIRPNPGPRWSQVHMPCVSQVKRRVQKIGATGASH